MPSRRQSFGNGPGWRNGMQTAYHSAVCDQTGVKSRVLSTKPRGAVAPDVEAVRTRSSGPKLLEHWGRTLPDAPAGVGRRAGGEWPVASARRPEV